MISRRILGMMSGSSLDGVDLAICRFDWEGDHFSSWKMEQTATIPYSDAWIKRLQKCADYKLADLLQLDSLLAEAYLQILEQFDPWEKRKKDIDAVALHGHTVLHQPEAEISLQLGSGAHVAKAIQAPVITQLRDADIEAGGQGAPLAPLADRFLFPGYAAYLNIGGISNCYIPNKKLAFDTGGANQLLNRLANIAGKSYDKEGQMAKKGQLIPTLLEELNKLPWFQKPAPKSLSNQWVREIVWPIIEKTEGSVADKLHTTTQHIAWHISEALRGIEGKILLSGGGAHNTYLVQCLQNHLGDSLFIPKPEVIDYKEAALTALVGFFRLEQIPAPICELTGASRNAVPGALYLPA
ncbi:MAG: anhydro-N-acetylmuramic acid kinase [Bacteroidetes bacterium]|nr:anhydro-N-acetylmuramic acid kinase [Bacteroidota bacterium]